MIITVPSADPFWLEPLINFLAVMLGAFLAWVTSYFFDKKAEKSRDLATSYSLLFKIHEICEQIIRLDAHVKECLARGQNDGFDGPVWGVILEAIGFGGSPSQITAEELALIARTKDDELVMKIRELEMGHRICFESYDRVIELKKSLSQSGFIKETSGQTVSFEATPEQFANLGPIFIGLQDSASGLIEILPGVAKQARDVASKLGPKLKGFYKFDHFMGLAFPEREEV